MVVWWRAQECVSTCENCKVRMEAAEALAALPPRAYFAGAGAESGGTFCDVLDGLVRALEGSDAVTDFRAYRYKVPLKCKVRTRPDVLCAHACACQYVWVNE